MSPTLAPWGVLLIQTSPFWGNHPVQQGDVVVFSSPDHEGQVLAKRILAVGEQRVEHGTRDVRVDGQSILREAKGKRPPHLPPGTIWKQAAIGLEVFSVWVPLGSSGPNAFTETHVPPDHAFVMGDHWRDSRDSRDFGAVPSSAIRGKVWATWSWEHGWKRL